MKKMRKYGIVGSLINTAKGTAGVVAKLLRRWPSRIGIIIVLIVFGMAIFAEVISPYDPYDYEQRDQEAKLASPSLKHLLGTDGSGTDLLSAIIHGSRVSVIVGFASAFLLGIIGMVVGIVAGSSSKIVDDILMRSADIVLVLPGLPIMILMVSYVGASYLNIIIVLGFLGWGLISRMVRSQTLSVKEQPYVEAAYSMGAGKLYIMRKHILPHVLPLVSIYMAITASISIIIEAGLSFLGLGDPTVESWGKILHAAQTGAALYLGAWWWVLFPGLMIVFTISGLILIQYVLDEILNPRLRARTRIARATTQE